jgi:hypothetical protein
MMDGDGPTFAHSPCLKDEPAYVRISPMLVIACFASARAPPGTTFVDPAAIPVWPLTYSVWLLTSTAWL